MSNDCVYMLSEYVENIMRHKITIAQKTQTKAVP